MKASVFIATSLDGYIATKDNDLSWLDEQNKKVPPGEDCGYGQFMASVDCLVMGRNTFEKVLSFGGDWPYGALKIVVLSRKGVVIPEALQNSVSQSNEDPTVLYGQLKQKGYQHLYIDGGQVIRSFLRAGLIDDITLTLIPVLLGEGISLWENAPVDYQFELQSHHFYEFGFMQYHYQIRYQVKQ
jgi:dihydrofolate reductase